MFSYCSKLFLCSGLLSVKIGVREKQVETALNKLLFINLSGSHSNRAAYEGDYGFRPPTKTSKAMYRIGSIFVICSFVLVTAANTQMPSNIGP